jgi:predicted hotdog family 3-hydroxylacyl-ACP dehydratase
MAALKLPPIEQILAHRGSMLLLDHLVSFNPESAAAEYTPREDAWYADEAGNMPGWIGLELMAQTVAAHVGLLKFEQNQPQKQGALLGTRRYVAHRPWFAAGTALNIEVTLVYRDSSGIGAYDCRIFTVENTLATATLTVYEPDDFQQFLQGPTHE